MNTVLFVISIGGSKIVPDEIDVEFLKKLKSIILKHVEKGHRFVFVAGGGRTSRKYQKAASEIIDNRDEIDWIGIYATKLNAYLLKSLFSDIAHKEIVDNYSEKINFKEKILVASGWKPGWSTDYDAVILAKWYDSKNVVNLTDVDYIYDKDPKVDKNAKPLKKLSWKEYKKIIGGKWTPGLHTPFDPIASKLAEEKKISVAVINKLENLDKFLSGKDFEGSTIG